MRYIFLSLILFCQSFAVFSQTATNSIHGIVTDSTGAVIPNVKVIVILLAKSDLNEKKPVETVTDDYGQFMFKNLSPGEYKIRIPDNRYGSVTEKLISIPQDKQIEIKVEFELKFGCEEITEDTGVLTDMDKSQILKLAVADALSVSSQLLESEQISKGIIVSTENIKPKWLKDVIDPKMKFMSRTQIQQKADSEGDYLFVSFPYFKVKGLCVGVEVANTWAVGKNSTTIYLSGGGYRYEFRKENGKWIKKFVGGWVS